MSIIRDYEQFKYDGRQAGSLVIQLYNWLVLLEAQHGEEDVKDSAFSLLEGAFGPDTVKVFPSLTVGGVEGGLGHDTVKALAISLGITKEILEERLRKAGVDYFREEWDVLPSTVFSELSKYEE